MTFTVELPFPISVNHAYHVARGRKFRTKRAKEVIAEMVRRIHAVESPVWEREEPEGKPKEEPKEESKKESKKAESRETDTSNRRAVWPLGGRSFDLSGVIFPPNRIKRDLDNQFKVLLDALEESGLIEDDSSIVRYREVEWGAPCKGGKAVITLTEIAFTPREWVPGESGLVPPGSQ